MNEPHFQGWKSNNKKTCISTLKVKYPKALQESCGEDSCADACEMYGDNGCVDCPVQKCMTKFAAYEDTGLEPEEISTDEELFKAYRHVCGGRQPNEIERALYLLDLEEQGRLIKLRCKVGDMVYKLEDYGEWQDNPHTFIPIKCQVELIFLGDDNKVYCDLVSIDDLFQLGDKFEEIPINEIYLSKEEAEKATEG